MPSTTAAARTVAVATGPYTTHLATAGEPTGEPLLFLHGTGPGASGALSFAPMLPGLASYRCLVPDLVGFGRSSHPESSAPGPGPWFALRVEAVLRLLDALGLERVHVVGHSYGARVALELLARAPERVDRAVLLAPGGTPVKADLAKLTGFYRNPTEPAMRTLVEAQMTRPAVSGTDDYIAERYTIATWPEVQRSFEAAMASGEPAPVYDASVLATVPHRVLAVHGKDDATISPAASLYIAEHLPGSDLHLFADCGHLLQFEVPRQLATMISEFVGSA